MLTRAFVPIVLLAAALATPAATADHDSCTGDVIDIGGLAYVYYQTAATHPGSPYLFVFFVCLESNGTPGLQPGGVTLLGDRLPCEDPSGRPDTCSLF